MSNIVNVTAFMKYLKGLYPKINNLKQLKNDAANVNDDITKRKLASIAIAFLKMREENKK